MWQQLSGYAAEVLCGIAGTLSAWGGGLLCGVLVYPQPVALAGSGGTHIRFVGLVSFAFVLEVCKARLNKKLKTYEHVLCLSVKSFTNL